MKYVANESACPFFFAGYIHQEEGDRRTQVRDGKKQLEDDEAEGFIYSYGLFLWELYRWPGIWDILSHRHCSRPFISIVCSGRPPRPSTRHGFIEKTGRRANPMRKTHL
jgi:hypothetical protein